MSLVGTSGDSGSARRTLNPFRTRGTLGDAISRMCPPHPGNPSPFPDSLLSPPTIRFPCVFSLPRRLSQVRSYVQRASGCCERIHTCVSIGEARRLQRFIVRVIVETCESHANFCSTVVLPVLHLRFSHAPLHPPARPLLRTSFPLSPPRVPANRFGLFCCHPAIARSSSALPLFGSHQQEFLPQVPPPVN